ncbi:hypothetical protein [Nocardia higoensis]|uniref:hypothetical protein n=1 Tax=Nocardia higoensis TaxID=228599 RepID=UPI0012F707F7|nr:hypothetical protein [Nocardia higoensis]
MTAFSVEISDLNGWAAQVGRNSGYMENTYTCSLIGMTSTDFGKILEIITADYAELLPKFHDALDTASKRLASTQQALVFASQEYVRVDSDWAGEIAELDNGQTINRTDDGEAAGFNDGVVPGMNMPTRDTRTLPEISLGRMMDKVCDLIELVGGPDPREHITAWIAGDIAEAGTQSASWDRLEEYLENIQTNIRHGQTNIAKTWTGQAATAQAALFGNWDTVWSSQRSAMTQMGSHLRDAVNEAVKLAQVVVDVVRTVIALASAGWGAAVIPLWGQVKMVRTATEAVSVLNEARKVLMLFWSLLRLIKDSIIAAKDVLSRDALPAEPAKVS